MRGVCGIQVLVQGCHTMWISCSICWGPFCMLITFESPISAKWLRAFNVEPRNWNTTIFKLLFWWLSKQVARSRTKQHHILTWKSWLMIFFFSRLWSHLLVMDFKCLHMISMSHTFPQCFARNPSVALRCSSCHLEDAKEGDSDSLSRITAMCRSWIDDMSHQIINSINNITTSK